MISAEAPILFAKACELFVLELSMRAWIEAESYKHRTLQRADVLRAISKTKEFDFLMYTIPRADESKVVSLPTPLLDPNSVSLAPLNSSDKMRTAGGAASALLIAAGVMEEGSEYTDSPGVSPRC